MNPSTDESTPQVPKKPQTPQMPQTIRLQLAPSWSETVEICIAALTRGTPEGERLACAELRRMARAADQAAMPAVEPDAPASKAAAVPTAESPVGLLAARAGKRLPLEVCYSVRGFYIGTLDDGLPHSRESAEYWTTREAASKALAEGSWTQRASA